MQRPYIVGKFLMMLIVLGVIREHACFNREIRIGWLGDNRTSLFREDENIAAPTMALDQARKDGIINADVDVRILYRDDNCNPKQQIGTMVELHEDYNVDAYVGLGCSASVVASGYYAVYWNKAIFSSSCTHPMVDDKSKYSTLIRVNPPYVKMGIAFLELVKYMGWTRIIIVQKTGACEYSTKAVFEHLTLGGIFISDWLLYTGDITEAFIDRALKQVLRKGRIVWLCGMFQERKTFLLEAHRRNMTSSDYAYFTPPYLPLDEPYKPWEDPSEEEPEQIRAIFSRVYQVVIAALFSPIVMQFRIDHRDRVGLSPWFINTTRLGGMYSVFTYDAMYLYLLAVNKSIELGIDPGDGQRLFDLARNITFLGISGNIALDENCDRQPEFWFYRLPADGDLDVWAEVRLADEPGQRVTIFIEDIWGTTDGKPPPDTPACGFFGERCLQDSDLDGILLPVIVVLAILFTITILTAVFVRRHRQEQLIREMTWRIRYEDMDLLATKQMASCLSLRLHLSEPKLSSGDHSMTSFRSNGDTQQLFGQIAKYQGKIVAVKTLEHITANMALNREDHLELNAMRSMSHENVNPFLGACIDPPNVCFITAYCPKGSLQDILESDLIKLDDVFKESFVADIINGLSYIHHSLIKSHGNLKSSNCIVDARWVLKITDFDPVCLKRRLREDAGDYEIGRAMLWTSPEILRMDNPPVRGSQEGDVYSFAIILQELLYRALPYFIDMLPPKDVVERIRNGESPPYRPTIPRDKALRSELVSTMISCWAEVPTERPSINEVRKMANKGREKRHNIIDSIAHKLESYAADLEDIVGKRTIDLMAEKKKTDSLLCQMLPQSVAESLKKGEMVEPKLYQDVTVYFSDVVNFDTMVSSASPLEITSLLNGLYEMVDSIVLKYDVYKVETIGDSYMVSSGVPVPNGRKHVTEIADMALDILSTSLEFRMPNLTEVNLKLRMGIHTGSCCAGVVGLSMPRYCLFGDTVNTASRMESHGEGLRIHISKLAYEALIESNGQYIMSERGEMDIKGKGKQRTFWLDGKAGFTRTLPNFNV